MTTEHLKQVPPDEAVKLNEEAIKNGKPSPVINEEQPIHPLYAYLYIADKFEGLILVNAATLLDGDPRNNFLERALTYNPNGVLNGANNIVIAGNFAYITTDKELVIVNLSNPLQPEITQTNSAQSAESRRRSISLRICRRCRRNEGFGH